MTRVQLLTDTTTQALRDQVPDGCALVIFGASGDLTRRKLVPALYALTHDGLLPDKFVVVGFARREKSHEGFRDEMRAAVDEFSRLRPLKPEAWDRLAQRLYYVSASFDDPAGYERLLLDCMLGDSTLFIRRDEVETAWALVTPVLEAWAAAGRNGLASYPARSWGPKEADGFIQTDAREWVNP